MLKSWQVLLAALLGLVASSAEADLISPVGVKATSEFGAVDVFGTGMFSSVFVTNLIDGSGLTGVGPVESQLHDNEGEAATMWHAGDMFAGIPGGLDGDMDPATPPLVDLQIVEFDLGGPTRLNTALVWQMNQGGIFGALAPSRGVDEMKILYSPFAAGDSFQEVDVFNLEVEEGTDLVPAQVLSLDQNGTLTAPPARRVRFDINTVHNPLSAPLSEFVGLSEVRFLGKHELVGDLDCDGDVDFDDIDDFVLGLNNPAAYEAALGVPAAFKGDIDNDGDLDFDDISGFVGLLTGGGASAAAAAVPEPSSLTLAVLTAVGVASGALRRRRW